MKNKNPLLIPYLREMLAAWDSELPKVIYESEPPVIVELIPALSCPSDQSLMKQAMFADLMPATLPKNTNQSHKGTEP